MYLPHLQGTLFFRYTTFIHFTTLLSSYHKLNHLRENVRSTWYFLLAGLECHSKSGLTQTNRTKHWHQLWKTMEKVMDPLKTWVPVNKQVNGDHFGDSTRCDNQHPKCAAPKGAPSTTFRARSFWVSLNNFAANEELLSLPLKEPMRNQELENHLKGNFNLYRLTRRHLIRENP